MPKNSPLTDTIYRHLENMMAKPHSPKNLELMLRLLGKWRSRVIQNTLLNKDGKVVLSGVFKGMTFIENSSEGCHVPKLIGSYEQPIHPFIEAAIKKEHPIVINIGCAEGYYAVGLATRMPKTKVHAYDIDARARETCRNLAEQNDVTDQIIIDELFQPEMFAEYDKKNALVVCDIEGAEKGMLDPAISPALKSMDIIVECHEEFVPGITALLIERFQPSHTCTLVDDIGNRNIEEPSWIKPLGHMDQLLATWEWRGKATPWLILTQRTDG